MATLMAVSTAWSLGATRPEEEDGVGEAGGCATATTGRSAPATRTRARAARRLTQLLQPIPVLQLLRQVLFGDEADATPGEGFELELLATLDHLLDLTLPLRLLEPGIGEHLLGPAVVAVVHLDGDVGRQGVFLLVEGRQTDEPRGGHRHAHRFVGEVDGALLHDAVDVEAPGVVVDQHVDRQLELAVQPLHEAPYPPRRLASALDDDAVVALPELVLVEARPDRILLDEEDVRGLMLAE